MVPVLGDRLSGKALGVLAGAASGVGAAISASLTVAAVSRRRDGTGGKAFGGTSQHVQDGRAHPLVIVISPDGRGKRPLLGWNAASPSHWGPTERSFTVVGGNRADSEGLRYGDECCSWCRPLPRSRSGKPYPHPGGRLEGSSEEPRGHPDGRAPAWLLRSDVHLARAALYRSLCGALLDFLASWPAPPDHRGLSGSGAECLVTAVVTESGRPLAWAGFTSGSFVVRYG